MERHDPPLPEDFTPEHPDSFDYEFDLYVFRREYHAWRRSRRDQARDAGLPVPDVPLPSSPEGLPPGWQIRAHLADPDVMGIDMDYYLIERVDGGWVVLEHETGQLTPNGPASTSLFETVGVTVADIYERAVRRKQQGADEHGRPYDQVRWPVDRMVAAYIAAHYYDMDDPEQAGEATLVGLGAPLAMMPATARVRPT
jgi:hypothetical protein